MRPPAILYEASLALRYSSQPPVAVSSKVAAWISR